MGKRGIFVSIEGINGIGKSRLVESIADHNSDTMPVKVHRFPTYDRPHGIKARKMLLLDKEEFNMHEFTLQCLLDMKDTYDNCIEPELVGGCMVIADRFIHTSVAFYSTKAERFTVSGGLVDVATQAIGLRHPDITFIIRKAPTQVFATSIGPKKDKDLIEEIFSKADWQKIDFAYSQMHRSKNRYGNIRNVDGYYNDFVIDRDAIGHLDDFIRENSENGEK